MKLSRRTLITAAVATPVAVAVGSRVVWSSGSLPEGKVSITVEGERRVIASNGVPEHATGDFPNPHDPVPLRAQELRYEVALHPKVAEKTTSLGMWHFGVAVNGVPFDPSGPFWNRDGNSGWQFEVLCPANAVALGIDVNRAHTQGRGMYHYHGLPTGLLWDVKRESPGEPMNLLGYASDGFPVYGPDARASADDLKSPARRLRSSYRLRKGRRATGPKGRFDGTFVEDFEYAPGLGDLDECNGRTGPTPESPDGTYYYVLTDDFPFIPRFLRGTPDLSFRHGPPPGVSPPVPPQLMKYQGRA